MATFLAADRGGSATRIRVIQDGQPNIDRTIKHKTHDVDPVASLIASTQALADEFGPFDRVAFGVSGLFGAPGENPTVRSAITRSEFSLVIADDAVTAYLGALGDRAGVVCAIGTGVVTVATDGSGRTARVDGWGFVGGDLGSAHWIAESAARAALGDIDGRWSTPAVRDAFLRRYEYPRAFASRTALRTSSKSYVADFAKDVVALAENGDSTAYRIIVDAAGHLADAIRTAAKQVEMTRAPVALTGALGIGSTVLSAAVRLHLAETGVDMFWTEPQGTPLDGACQLATGAARVDAWNEQIVTCSENDPESTYS